MPAYDDRHFSPPAPILQANLRNPQTGASAPDVMLLIDTGADVTLLPKAASDSVDLERTGTKYELVSFDGATSTAEAVRADLVLLGRTFRGQFLVIDNAVGILGRDILNGLSLLLDGPRLTWEEHAPAAEDA